MEINFPPAASTSFLAAATRSVVGFSRILFNAFAVYCPVRQKCMTISLFDMCCDQWASRPLQGAPEAGRHKTQMEEPVGPPRAKTPPVIRREDFGTSSGRLFAQATP